MLRCAEPADGPPDEAAAPSARRFCDDGCHGQHHLYRPCHVPGAVRRCSDAVCHALLSCQQLLYAACRHPAGTLVGRSRRLLHADGVEIPARADGRFCLSQSPSGRTGHSSPEPCDELREIHQQHRHTAGAAADGLHHPRDWAAQPAPDTHARRDDGLPLCHLTGAGRCPLRAARHRRSGAQRICRGVGHAGRDADGRRRGGIRRGRAAGRAGRGDLHPRLLRGDTGADAAALSPAHSEKMRAGNAASRFSAPSFFNSPPSPSIFPTRARAAR